MVREIRLKLGIIFNFESSWLGGIIYILNLIKTLDFLEEKEKPEIFLFYRGDLEKYVKEIHYPYLNLIVWEFPSITSGHLGSWLKRKNLFIHGILKSYDLDTVFPLQDYPVKIKTNVKLISWNADFQYKHYPDYFTRRQNFGRALRTKLALKNSQNLVLSSNDAKQDLYRYFKVRKEMKIYIYNFVSIIDDLEDIDIVVLREKYSLPEKFFLISNQFHKHKNHKIVFLALARLKVMGIKVHIAVTGRMPVASDSPYMEELHAIISENGLEDQISLLGIISRSEQLVLMKNSQAVIQPSLFEGWSTVIEDARSLQVPVIASNLKVNIEQLGEKGNYFDPKDDTSLQLILKSFPERDIKENIYQDYFEHVKEAAINLRNIFLPD